MFTEVAFACLPIASWLLLCVLNSCHRNGINPMVELGRGLVRLASSAPDANANTPTRIIVR